MGCNEDFERSRVTDTAPPEDDEVGDARHRRERSHALASDRTSRSTDSTRVYLKEIGRVPLLTSAEEVRLAERVAKGMKAEEELALHHAAETLDSIDPTRRALLERHVRTGDAAKNDLTQANLRLVVSIAKRYSGRGIPLLDLEYTEDVAADVDANVVMTGDGSLIEVQGTAEGEPYTRAQLDTMLDYAAAGIESLVTMQIESRA